MTRVFPLLVLLASMLSVPAQEIFRLDFEDEFVPDEWEFTEKSEWGHTLGEEGSSFFRFHPFSWRDVLQTPAMELEEGYYVLYYSWNEAGEGNPDFSNIRIRENDGYWESLDRIGVGNNRSWQKDSTVIGMLPASNYTLEFEYKSLGHFPSQYLNLDNIYLVRTDVVISSTDLISDIDFKLYPNPVHSQLYYVLKAEGQQMYQLVVTNAIGAIVKQEKMIHGSGMLDVSELPQGIYNLELQYNDQRTSKRFIIQK